MSSFNLEKSIQSWRNKLHKYQEIEPGDIEEFEDHLRNSVEELENNGLSTEAAFEKVINRDWKNPNTVSQEFRHVRTNSNSLLFPLLSNFLKVSFRSIRKRWSFSLINLFGLVIGLASVFGISIYVIQELSYDRFNENGSEIYRVVNYFERASGTRKYPSAPPALAPTIGTSLPGIKRVARLRESNDIQIEYNEKQFIENDGFYADSTFLEIFSFPLSTGDIATALDEPNSIVLTQELARKYFANENPLGKVLVFNGDRSLKVTGVFEGIPKTSHISFDFLISFSTFIVPEGYLADLTCWGWVGFPTYFQLDENADIKNLEASLVQVYKTYNTSKANTDIKVTLQPLFDIYLNSNDLANPNDGMFATNSLTTILSLVAVAILILFVAAFNYLNITLASFQTRFKEMGMRQVMGSGKPKILTQLILESSIVVFFSGVIALTLAYGGLSIGFGEIDAGSLINLKTIIIGMLCLTTLSLVLGLIVGIAAGSTLVDSKMLELLKGQKKSQVSRGYLRNSMLFVQYVISAGLIMLSIIVGRQINFVNEKELGFEKEGVLLLTGNREEIMSSFTTFEQRLSENPNIQYTSISNHALEGDASGNSIRISSWPADQSINTAYFQVGYDFDNVMGINLIEGRFFSRDIASDSNRAVIINETAARALNITTLENQKVLFTNDEEVEVIGIMEDFHFRSLHHEIGPMVFIMPFTNQRFVVVKYRTDNLDKLISQIETDWGIVNPGGAKLSIDFLDDILAQQYQKDYFFSNLVKAFTFLAILIACLGLWGLTSIAINLKIRQISIRKVLGAKPHDLILNIGKMFLLTSFAGTIVSWPIVSYASTLWLENFAYAIEPGLLTFLQSLLIITFISGITMTVQYFKIIKTNPAKILQNDG